MELGYLQKSIVKLGKEKGFVTSDDIRKFYARDIEMEMNKLVILGYFEEKIDMVTFIKWIYKGGKNETNKTSS